MTNMEPQRLFTTTLPDSLLHELERAAQELGMRKKDIIIEAFTSWNKERQQARLAESYSRMSDNDKAKLLGLADEWPEK
jgi:hypothetical protein